MLQDVNSLVSALVDAGIDPEEITRAIEERKGAKPEAKKETSDRWKPRVLRAAEEELMMAGTVTIVNGEKDKGLLIGRDAQRPNKMAMVVADYHLDSSGEYRVRHSRPPGTEPELLQWLTWHAQVANGITGTQTKNGVPRRRVTDKSEETEDGFDVEAASFKELKEYAREHGWKIDGRWKEATVRTEVRERMKEEGLL